MPPIGEEPETQNPTLRQESDAGVKENNRTGVILARVKQKTGRKHPGFSLGFVSGETKSMWGPKSNTCSNPGMWLTGRMLVEQGD